MSRSGGQAQVDVAHRVFWLDLDFLTCFVAYVNCLKVVHGRGLVRAYALAQDRQVGWVTHWRLIESISSCLGLPVLEHSLWVVDVSVVQESFWTVTESILIWTLSASCTALRDALFTVHHVDLELWFFVRGWIGVRVNIEIPRTVVLTWLFMLVNDLIFYLLILHFERWSILTFIVTMLM